MAIQSHANMAPAPEMEPPSDENGFAVVEAVQWVGCYASDAPMAGGYSRVELPDKVVNDLAILAAQTYANESNNETLQSCDVSGLTTEYVNVLAACSQVVAGMNYRMGFEVMYPCADGDVRELLVAEVYQPLPSSNEMPTVTSVMAL